MKEVKVNYQKMKENESNLRTRKNERIKKEIKGNERECRRMKKTN